MSDARLSGIAAVSDQKVKTAQYREVLTELLAGGGDGAVEGLKHLVLHMLSDDVPLVISRQILQTLCAEIQTLPAEQHKETAEFALQKISPRVVSFEEQVSVLREGLAALHQTEEEWSRAAGVLAGIDLDSGIRVLSDEYKLQKCVQIATLYLQDDDAINAETFIKKAAFLLAACKVRARVPRGDLTVTPATNFSTLPPSSWTGVYYQS
jgi:COP9 signalosome complex subunit 4